MAASSFGSFGSIFASNNLFKYKVLKVFQVSGTIMYAKSGNF